jgi:hypothetical protein
MGSKRWRVQGFDSDKVVLQETIGYESSTEAEIIALLQRLASKHLADHEIINASRRKGDVGYSSELEPTIDRSSQLNISVGSNPHFVASVFDYH